jgi:predicted nuclease with TOPRIM domain
MAEREDAEPLTVAILRSIRDEIHELRTDTKSEFGQLRTETKSEFQQLRAETSERLDHIATGQIRLATEFAGLRGEVVELKGEVVELRSSVDRQTARFDHFLETDGNVVRDLKHRVERLEEHTGLPRPRGRRSRR